MKAVEERRPREGPVEDLAVLLEEIAATVGLAEHATHAAADKHRVVEGAAAADAAHIMLERLVGGLHQAVEKERVKPGLQRGNRGKGSSCRHRADYILRGHPAKDGVWETADPAPAREDAL